MTVAEVTFAADFDPLTLAPSRRQLKSHIDRLIKENAEYASSRTPAFSVVVMMLDLDYFKQANDTAGHTFGDAILRATAWRLASFSKEIMPDDERGDFARDMMIGRWGGEEFVLAAVLQDDDELIQQVANNLCKKIAIPPIPTDEEREKIYRLSPELRTNPPAEPARAITASAGWTKIQAAKTNSEVATLLDQGIERADAAMYRAKATGKNRACAFSAILSEHGRVIEHRTDAGLVIIDIGSFVGVRKGDKFAVFPGEFVGDVTYIRSDGRTERPLGLYPRWSAAIIEVFDAPARDAAFCKILSIATGVTEIPKGAHIKLVPQPTTSDPVSPAERRQTMSPSDTKPVGHEGSLS
jgi:diguanylate cyclase (GGDEF)-like protein